MPSEKPTPRSNYERWMRPPQGRTVNWLQEYRESDEYRRQIQIYKKGLFNVPKLGEVAAMISEMNSKAVQGKRRPTIHGRPTPNPEDPKWVHADVLNSLHEIVAIFPGTHRVRNDFKTRLYQLIEDYYGSPYQTTNPSHWYRQVTFAIEMAVCSVRENRTSDNDRCVVPGLTEAINDAIETCVAERAGLTLEEYRNETPSGETNMTIQDSSKNASNLTAVGQAVTDLVSPTNATPVATDIPVISDSAPASASNVQEFQNLVDSFPSTTQSEFPGGVRAITLKPARAYIHEDGKEVQVDLETMTKKDTTEMNTPDTAAQAASTIQSAAAQIPEAAREIHQSVDALASQAARSAQETLNNAGDKLHAAAQTLKGAMKQPSLWGKVRTAAKWTAGIAAVGGVAYVAYRYFKDGQGPVETMSGAVEAAKEVVSNAASS